MIRFKKLINEMMQLRGKYQDGTEFEVDPHGKPLKFIYNGNEIPSNEWKDLGYLNGWSTEEKAKYNSMFGDKKVYSTSLNNRGTLDARYYPELKMYYLVDSSD